METLYREYGVATTVDFDLYQTSGTELKTDAAHAAGDTKIMLDEAAEGNTTNGFTDEGQGYSIALTAAELTAARVVLYVVDQGTKAWIDRAIRIETTDHHSAQHPNGVIRRATAAGGGATSITLDASASASNDIYNNGLVFIKSGTGAGQWNIIVDYDGGTQVATVLNTWVTNPDSSSVFMIYAAVPSITSATLGRKLLVNSSGHVAPDTTIAMTEAYSADGGTATIAQALYEIKQQLQESSVSSTTLTVKKVDGSTTAMTFTLDSATDPTSITRAS